MYKMNGRVRYSETDENQVLTLTSAIDYFQDAAIFNSQDVGVGPIPLFELGKAWVMCSWQLEVIRYPVFGEKIEVVTYPYGFKSFFGNRNCYMLDEKGEMIIKANCIWTMLDVNTMKPCRVPEDIINHYSSGEPIEMDYKPRKIIIPDVEGQACQSVTIERQHLDSMKHVNNGQYIKIAMNYIKHEGSVTKFRAEYKSQAHLGDIVIPVYYETDAVEVVALTSQSGEIYAVIEVEK